MNRSRSSSCVRALVRAAAIPLLLTAGCLDPGADAPAQAASAVIACPGGGPPTALCFADNDGDGRGAGALTARCECTGGWVSNNNDCDDSSALRYQTLSCYVDSDGDHYGAGSTVSTCAGETCFDGVALRSDSAGDCNNADPAVLPHTTETSADAVDNNCSGEADEAVPMYYPTGNANTSSSFRVTFRLTSAADRAAAASGGLQVRPYYRALAQHSGSYTVGSYTPATTWALGGEWYASITVSGLDELTVYELRADFYRSIGGLMQRVTPESACFGTSATGCSNTGLYYTITLPSGTSTPVKTARANLVLRALDDYDYFRTHAMGQWNDDLAVHYQLRSRTQAWCSEFYSSNGQSIYANMNPCRFTSASATPYCDATETSEAEDSVEDLNTWFSPYANALVSFNGTSTMATLLPGDRLAVNPDASFPDGVHTQMFLAWDATAGDFWYVDGNGSYSNTWGSMSHTANVDHHDLCDSTTCSEGGHCPVTAYLQCPGESFRIRRAGLVNNSNMLDP